MSDLSKLPKWAQEHIQELQRQRNTAVRELREWRDDQTPAPFRIREFVSLESGAPEVMTRHIQSNTMQIDWIGIEVDITLRKDSIDISYSSTMRMLNNVILQPQSFQQIALIPVRGGEKKP